MKTRFFSLTVSLGVLAAFCGVSLPTEAQAPPLPNLRIAQVFEYNTTARVRILNSGLAASAPCLLRAYRWVAGFGWVFVAQGVTPALAPGQSQWVSVTGNGIALPNTLYTVDATFVVAESNEGDNRTLIP